MASPEAARSFVQALLNVTPGWTAMQDIGGLIKAGGTVASSVAKGRGLPKAKLHGQSLVIEDPDLDTQGATTGRFITVRPEGFDDPDVLKHEERHSKQSTALGPAMIPTAIVEGLSDVMSGSADNYGAGPLERDAFQHTTPNTEMLREGSSEFKKPRAHTKAVQTYLRAILGE